MQCKQVHAGIRNLRYRSSIRQSREMEPNSDPAPMHDAPYYKGPASSKTKWPRHGRRFGRWTLVAVLFAREVADVAIVYLDGAEDVEDYGRRW